MPLKLSVIIIITVPSTPAPLQLRNDGGAAGEDWVPVFKTEVGSCAAEWAEWAAGVLVCPCWVAQLISHFSLPANRFSKFPMWSIGPCSRMALSPAASHLSIARSLPARATLCRCAWTTQTPCGSPSRWTSASCAAQMSSARSSCRQAGLGWNEMLVVRRGRMRQAPSLPAARSRPTRCPSALLTKANRSSAILTRLHPVQVWDYQSSGKHQLIGECRTTLAQLQTMGAGPNVAGRSVAAAPTAAPAAAAAVASAVGAPATPAPAPDTPAFVAVAPAAATPAEAAAAVPPAVTNGAAATTAATPAVPVAVGATPAAAATAPAASRSFELIIPATDKHIAVGKCGTLLVRQVQVRPGATPKDMMAGCLQSCLG